MILTILGIMLVLNQVVDSVAIDEISTRLGSEESADAGPDQYLRMTELLDEAVKKLAKLRCDEGLNQLKKKNYPGALQHLKCTVAKWFC